MRTAAEYSTYIDRGCANLSKLSRNLCLKLTLQEHYQVQWIALTFSLLKLCLGLGPSKPMYTYSTVHNDKHLASLDNHKVKECEMREQLCWVNSPTMLWPGHEITQLSMSLFTLAFVCVYTAQERQSLIQDKQSFQMDCYNRWKYLPIQVLLLSR